MLAVRVHDGEQKGYYLETSFEETETFKEIIWRGIKELDKDDPQRKMGELYLLSLENSSKHSKGVDK